MGVYLRCMEGFKSNHRLARKHLGHSDPNAFGHQAWQEKDLNWEVRISSDPASEPNEEDDRCDSDPRRKP